VRTLWLIICHECEDTTLYVVLCECHSFRGVPNCRWSLRTMLAWSSLWTVTRQPSRRQPCVRAESCCLCCVVSGTAMYFVYWLICILYIVCIWICDFMRCVEMALYDIVNRMWLVVWIIVYDNCILINCFFIIMYLLIVFCVYSCLLWSILYVSKYPVHVTCKFALPG